MRVKIHLTEPEHANNPVLGEIESSADMMIEELVSTLESLILDAYHNSHDFSEVFTSRIEEARSKLREDDNQNAPLFYFHTTLTGHDDSGAATAKATLDHEYWIRFERIVDLFHGGLDAFDQSRLTLEIDFASSSQGQTKPGMPNDPDSFYIKSPWAPLIKYVRVGTLHEGTAKELDSPTSSGSDIKLRQAILAPVDKVPETEVADNLRLVSAIDMGDALYGDVDDSVPVTFAGTGSKAKGSGLFSHFEDVARTNKSALGGLVREESRRQLKTDLLGRSSQESPDEKRRRAPTLPSMTLARFDHADIGNATDIIFGKNMHGRVAVRVVYEPDKRWARGPETKDERKAYPKSWQFPLTKGMKVQHLENNLFEHWDDEADAIKQAVNLYRTSPWYCKWWLKSIGAGSDKLYEVEDMDATLASYVHKDKGKSKVHMFTECHIHKPYENLDVEVGYGINPGPGLREFES